MAQVIDANSEGGFVLASLMEFMKAWESGANARLFLESTNGSAFVSFGCFLGQPTEMHVKPKKKEKSKKKQERDNLRAANFQAAMNENGGESAESDESVIEDVVIDQDNDETAGGNPLATETEDVDDSQEFMIKCLVDLKVDGLNHQNWGPEFGGICPEIKTQVVDYVLGQDDNSLQRSDIEVYDVKGQPLAWYKRTKEHRWSVEIKYRQNMRNASECFHEAFKRHLEARKEVFVKDKSQFRIRDCSGKKIS